MTSDHGEVGWDSRAVRSAGATIEAQSLGDPVHQTVLLVAAATWSRDWWDDELCAAFVAAGMRVIRYDTRDTGGSTRDPIGDPTYTASDLADDAIAVLDAFGVARALVLGLSMGGGLAQLIATRHADRVAGLVLVSTSPADGVDRGLPGPTPEILATFTAETPGPDWSDRDAVVEWVIESERPYAGPDTFDADAMRLLVARVWDRTPSMAAAATNHFIVAESAATIDLSGLRGVPAVVVHGSDDPLFPLAHGRALASVLDAPLVVLQDVGHQAPPRRTWAQLVRSIADLASKVSATQ